MATVKCKNCGYEFEGNYCSQCGQKAKTQRLDWHYLSDEAKYTFLHINGGLLYTAKQLFVRPGDMVREFIEGKRVHHYKPILLLFVLGGIYSVLLHYVYNDQMLVGLENTSEAAKQMGEKVADFMMDHYALTEIVFLPILAFFSWLTFRPWGYNFIEHIILNTFAASQRIIASIVISPLIFCVFDVNTITGNLLRSMSSMTVYICTVWMYLQFFKGRDLGITIIRYIVFAILSFTALLVILAVVLLVLAIYFPHAVGLGSSILTKTH